MAQKSSTSGVTESIQQLGTQAERHASSVRKRVRQMDIRGVERVAHDVNSYFSWSEADDPDALSAVDKKMQELHGGIPENTPAWFNARKEVVADLANQVYLMGDALKSIEETGDKPLNAKANSMKKIATNAKQASQSVGKLGRQLTIEEHNKLFNYLREGNTEAFEKMASELLGKNVNLTWEKMKAFYEEGRRGRADRRAQLPPSPESQRRAETRRAIRDTQHENRDRNENIQQADKTVEDFKAQQAKTRSILSRLTHRNVTNKGIDRALEEVEKGFEKQLPNLRKSLSDSFKAYMGDADKEPGVPRENRLERAQFLAKFQDRIDNPLKYARTTDVLSDITGKKVTSATKDSVFSELEAKLGKDKLGEDYYGMNPKKKAMYLHDAFEKEKQAAEKAVKEAAKTENEVIADTVESNAKATRKKSLDRKKAATETADIEKKKAKEVADAEVNEAKRVAKAKTSPLADKMMEHYANQYKNEIDKYIGRDVFDKASRSEKRTMIEDLMQGKTQKAAEAKAESEKVVANEKSAAESVKKAVNDIADTKIKKAKETTAVVSQEAKKQAQAETKAVEPPSRPSLADRMLEHYTKKYQNEIEKYIGRDVFDKASRSEKRTMLEDLEQGKIQKIAQEKAQVEKKAANEVVNAEEVAAAKGTDASKKKNEAKKKSAVDAAKTEQKEIKATADAEEAAANKSINATKKKEEAKKQSARKGSGGSGSGSGGSGGDDGGNANEKALERKRVSLERRLENLRAKYQDHMAGAPEGERRKSYSSYANWLRQEKSILKDLSALGVEYETFLPKWKEYKKIFTADSSIAKDKAMATLNKAFTKLQKEQRAEQKETDKDAVKSAEAMAKAEKEYGVLQDRYTKSVTGGKAVGENKFAQWQKDAERLQNILKDKEGFTPFRMEKDYSSYEKVSRTAQERTRAAKELEKAERNLENVYNRQNSLISRGKQLTVDQYEAVRKTGEEAKKRAIAAGSQRDMTMPLDKAGYNNVADFNRNAIIKNAMSWSHQGVDSYTNSINRLKHAQEALFSAYQRDPHPKYLQMLGKTRAELSRVTNEYKKYQKQINDTGTTWDKFMMRARSHLEWIASGFALSTMFVLPAQFMNTLEDLEAKMAGIKQVIPMIEGLKDDEKFGTKEQQIARAKKETEDLVNLAARYGASVDEVMEATRSIGRMYGQGESGVTNTNLMVTQATRMAVADAFDLIDATRGLESAMSQWNLQTENTQELLINTNRILDVWTKTAHRGAASAQDIADAIQLAGTAAYQAGVSFEFFNALVATGVRATARSGNEIGTSIKSMMVSMQTPKAEKALKEWGISLREIGTDGQLHMRNLEDVILDVAMAVQTTEKDTKDLFLALSGGKFQYSKVSAMLKNGDELLRMLREINNPDTVGFTGEQIQVQLDTLSRKVATIKDDLQGMVFNIGGIDVMKDFANSLDNLIVGISQLSKAFGGHTLSVAASIIKWGLYLRILYKGATMLRVAYESFKIFKEAQTASTVATGQQIGVLQAWYAAKMKEIHGLAAGRMSRLGYVVATEAESKATTESTVATTAETAAHERNVMVINAETTGYIRNAAAKKGEAIATAASTAATAGAMGKLAQGAGLAGGAVAALGGPIGIAITALTILIPIIYEWASAVGEANNKMKRTAEIYEDEIAKMEQQIQKTSQSADMMERLAKQYNKIYDSLAECTEGTQEYMKKQEQLKRIKDVIMEAVKDEAKLFDENHHIKMDAIQEWEKKTNEEKRAYIDGQAAKAKVDLESTEQSIVNTENRIRALKTEMEVLKQSGATWDWLSQMRNGAWRKIGEFEVWAGKHYGDKTMIENGERTIARADAERIGENGSGDIEYIEEALAKADEQLQTLREQKSRYINIIASAEASHIRDEEGNSANNPEERGTVDEDEEGGKGHGSGGSGSGSGGKSRLPYETDELAAAIHEAAQTQYAKDNSLTEPLLRGLADVQSGLSQDFNDGVRIGAFGVTEEMGRRFGQDVYTPIGNAMTAVLTLTQRISDAGGDMGAALNSFTGGNASGVYTAMRAQQDAYNYDGTDYIGSSDFGNDVIAAARQRLGLPYGGGDLSDEFQTVCTTFIQRALVDAGADEAIVRSLTADASNWSTQAGAAFHSYGDGYAPKPGDVAITNIHPEDNGHGWHVVLVDENGTGYYSAGGKAGESAHYDTPIETAFEDDIEGYIDIAALTGKTRGLGLRSKGSNARKSVFDFRRNSYEQLMYQIQKAKEDYEDEAKDIELERAMTGDSYELAAREQLNEQAKLTVEQNSLKIMEAMYRGVQKSIENTIKNAPDLQVALGQEGAKWADLVPEEKKQLVSLYKNDNGVFAELVNEEIKLHDALREQAKVVKEQTLKANKYLHMSIEEAAKFENNRLQMKYENFEAGLPDDNDSFYLNHVKSVRAKKEMLEGQIANSTNVRDWAYNQYSQSFEKDQAELAKIQAEIQAGKEHLAILQQEAEGGRDVAGAIQAQEQELTNLIASYDILARIGSPETQRLEETFLKADTAVKQLQKDLDKVAKQDLQNVRNYGAQMFTDLIVEGKSFEDVWKSLWKDLARYTINAIFGANNSGNIWGSIFSIFGGGKANGGGLAHGGRIPGYAQGGGMIKGAGTGTSDSILAYLANKDKFVYLSNGEYVMTAEATKRIGIENLDALNGYADGGAIAPTPYVPTLSNRATKRAGVLSNKNPNARMEQLMQEQTNVIQNLSSGGSGQVVVLNTKASSADVLKAMQENPRQVQAILGQQRRAGFR